MDDLVAKIIKMFLSVATPQIVNTIRLAVDNMVKEAAKTDNPWDDMFAGLLQTLVGKPDNVPIQ